MILNLVTGGADLSLIRAEDPQAAARFVQAELTSQIATNLASRTSRLQTHLGNLVRAFQMDETMRKLAPGTTGEVPPASLFSPLSAGNLALLDQFVDKSGLVLASTASEAEVLAQEMTDLGLQPPPVMYPVLTYTRTTVTSSKGEVLSSSTGGQFSWMTAQQRTGLMGTQKDLGNSVSSRTFTLRLTSSDERTSTVTTFCCLDRKANRRFTESQLMAVRDQIAGVQQSMLPELQSSSAAVVAQTAALDLLVKDFRESMAKVEDRKENMVEERREDGRLRSRDNERRLDERLGRRN
ncbi:hypothetical protein [Lacisediminimonas profundi]|uniref:hypothetical protein n=1 Tax=Lacisediminimonas profundi TaxID=2603856 RepID=UPI0013869E80|nr:hypothetical protein [Lacisediminimonas profundi]